MTTSPSVIAALFAGVLSFFTPCVLPLVPAYLSMVTGMSVLELQEGASGARLKVLRGTGLFFAGFTFVFVLLGTAASAVGSFLLANQRYFNIAAGIVVVLFGLLIIGFVRPHFLEQERRFRVTDTLDGWGAPILGAAFAFGWTPCIGPILGAVLAIASTQGTAFRGAFLLFVYSLGLGIPFLVSGLALSETTRLFDWAKRHFRAINITAGLIMVTFGLLMAFNQMSRISYWLIERGVTGFGGSGGN